MSLTACSEPDDGSGSNSGYSIDDNPLSGTINGTDWTVAVAVTDPSLEADDKTVHYAHVYADANASCDDRPEGVPHLIVTVPKQEGQFALGPALNATFAYQESDMNVFRTTFDGALVVTKYTDDAETFEAALVARRTGAGSVNGTFKVTVCQHPHNPTRSMTPRRTLRLSI